MLLVVYVHEFSFSCSILTLERVYVYIFRQQGSEAAERVYMMISMNSSLRSRRAEDNEL